MGNTGISLITLALGATLLWSGLHGASVLATIKDVLQGKGLSPVNINPVASGTTSGDGTSTVPASSSQIASDAEKYQGDAYVWGASGPDRFDCSGLVNWVTGHDLHLAIPGSPSGAYSGHGPVTEQWYAWTEFTSISATEMQPGDIVCWITHMGIAVSNTMLISALDPALGVKITSIPQAAPFGEPIRIGRYS
jgi:peptidoglycan DL-endopeptidase CwlO